MTIALHGWRVEKRELEAAAARGDDTCWGVQAGFQIRDGWLLATGPNRRFYAPLEHTELSREFSALANADDAAIVRFAEHYGRLGRQELLIHSPDTDSLRAAVRKQRRQFPKRKLSLADEPIDWIQVHALDHEPLSWIRAHAATVRWCLEAGLALQRGKSTGLTGALEAWPAAWGQLWEVGPVPGRRLGAQLLEETVPAGIRVAHLLADVLTINLRPGRLVVHARPPRLLVAFRHLTLLDAIYALTASHVAGGRLARCQYCRRIFVRADAREKFCPRPADQKGASICGGRARVRKHRRKPPRRERRSE